ncbi:MAG: DUF6320 domain-containing protein [Clostridiales bacterium]|nr:DUF6320 domain-containing protein [Clostridiales bacterium]
MRLEITYPVPSRRASRRLGVIRWFRWPFLAAAVACPVINLAIGGKWWSVVVLWALYMAWGNLFATAMIDYNRVSQSIRWIVQCCVLLFLIDWLLAPGWALLVVPMVAAGGLVLASILFFSDFSRQRQNVAPLLLLCIGDILYAAGFSLAGKGSWSVTVLASLSPVMLIALIACTGRDFFRSLHKYFHLKS